jgi:poly-gamma-glutamate synthase PgsB/CapB
MMRDKVLRRLLEYGLNRHQLKVHAGRIDQLLRAFAKWPERPANIEAEPGAEVMAFALLLASFLRHRCQMGLQSLYDLRALFADYSRRQGLAESEAHRRAYIIEFAAALGASGRRLRQDRRALKRWFDYDAVADRYRRRVGETEQQLAFDLERYGNVAAAALGSAPLNAVEGARAWGRFDVETLLGRLMIYDGDSRVRAAAFAALAAALKALPAAAREAVLSEHVLQLVYRAALDHRQETWIQCRALEMMKGLSPAAFASVAERRLSHPRAGDDMFVRRRVVHLLSCGQFPTTAIVSLLEKAGADPSPFVRQAVPEMLLKTPRADGAPLLARLARADTARQVRAAALLSLIGGLEEPARRDDAMALLAEVCASETDGFVLRTACKVIVDGADRLMSLDEAAAARWHQRLAPCLERLHTGASTTVVRRWAAQARERLWCRSSPAAWQAYERLLPFLAAVRRGRMAVLPRRLFGDVEPELLGRVAAVIAQSDFGIDLWRTTLGKRLARGDLMRFRLWRFIHELRFSATDKRQAHNHMIGRVYYGTVHAPSAILAELAQTKVPGEPLYVAEEGGWRPYLPLVDHALSIVDTGKPVSLFTSEGITEVAPPKGLLRRLRARLALTWRFARYARLRNWTPDSGLAPTSYLRELAELGIVARLKPYPSVADPAREMQLDPTVARFFPAFLPVIDGGLWERFENYLFSVYQNTLRDLALFLVGAVLLFFGRHIYVNGRLQRARRRIPLVLGGWGTRGKSGTERLKAAVMNALGYGIVSKTTGCEAMFLYAPAFGRLREMFLFRPYDKATIWEQYKVVMLAKQLGCDSLLWECMALNPAFVNLMQRSWMRDDVATITNTYPDHEDIQGPAGRDIPEVMCNFIPRNSAVVTSEEQMLPILAEAAKELNSRLVNVTWLEAGLLTDDVLRRFPYEEHPYNIALVAAMAEELGIERDFALKEMADRVVPDLGVLKAYPIAHLRTRRLEFVNGMSANERFGCLSNWTRMGFDTRDPEKEPGVWLTTVVNNRADRVARSRVFAGVVVNDLAADRHVLIGSNLEGLSGFIAEAWAAYEPTITLWPESAAAEAPTEVLHRLARRMRLASTDQHVIDRLRVMLESDPQLPVDELALLRDQPEAFAAALAARNSPFAAVMADRLAEWREQRDDIKALEQRLAGAGAGDRAQIDAEVRRAMAKWFQRKVIVVHDFYATGDQIVDRICEETPPGFLNRIMGIQNIKGTGLDFVYRWQAWQTCYDYCQQLRSKDPLVVARGVADLASFKEHGLLTEELVREVIAELRRSATPQTELQRSLLAVIETSLDERLAAIRAAAGGDAGRQTRFSARLLTWLEAFHDAGDAVRRRKKADLIYRDLIGQRISADRAVLELQELTKRQKGGWLAKDLGKLSARIRAAVSRQRWLKPKPKWAKRKYRKGDTIERPAAKAGAAR